jgi:hypothetical protein
VCDVFAIKYQLRFRPIFVFVQATLDPVAGIKDVKKYARQEHGTKFSSREIGDYLFEMDANDQKFSVHWTSSGGSGRCLRSFTVHLSISR